MRKDVCLYAPSAPDLGGGGGERWFLQKISRLLSLSSPLLPLAGAHDKVPHTLLSLGSLSNDFDAFFLGCGLWRPSGDFGLMIDVDRDPPTSHFSFRKWIWSIFP